NGRRWSVYFWGAVLGTTPLALGCNDHGRSAGSFHSESARCPDDDSVASWPHRTYLLLGCSKAFGEHALRFIKSSYRQNGRGHGTRVETARGNRRITLSWAGSYGGGASRRRVRPA